MFEELRCLADEKRKVVGIAQRKIAGLDGGPDAVQWLSSEILGRREFVLFVGAGISIPGASGAPSFAQLRDSVLEAMSEELRERKVLSRRSYLAIIEAVRQLPNRRFKMTVPPELVFSELRDSLGNAALGSILRCLAGGNPNENHKAIRVLADSPRTGLRGVVTPNFDCYIEAALEGADYQVLARGSGAAPVGFSVLKPHGTLSDLSSILITLEELRRPPNRLTLEQMRKLVARRTVIVFGYSGFDFDLFPLLVHAGEAWETTVVWVLWQKEDRNEQTGKLVLALGEHCELLNGNRAHVLAELAGLRMEDTARPVDPTEHLRATMTSARSAELIYALVSLVGPFGVPDDVEAELLEHELMLLSAGPILPEPANLQKLLQILTFSQDDSLRRAAVRLGEKIGDQVSRPELWRLRLEYHAAHSVKAESTAEEEIAEEEAGLACEFYPHLEGYPSDLKEKLLQFMTASSFLRIAELLNETEHHSESIEIVHRILSTYNFPKSSLSSDAVMWDERSLEGKLRCALARTLSDIGDRNSAERELCQSIEILWRELNTWDLSFALDIAVELVVGSLEYRCIESILDLAVGIARIVGPFTDELERLVDKLESGFCDTDELTRTHSLLQEAQSVLDREEFDELERRFFDAERRWFREGKAVFLDRMRGNN